MPMKKLNQIGDTIVEVLIALTILAMAIGTAYAISNKSIKSAQQAQERTQATKFVEGQIDKLKYLSESENVTDIAAFTQSKTATKTSPKCLDSVIVSGQPVVRAYGSSEPLCLKNDIFKISFSYNGDNRLFTVSTNWDSLGFSAQENVTMEYRVVLNE
jgi:type II secretory pathway pseudopilin PulG